MHKFALCIYGNFNNRLNQNSGLGGFHYISEILLSKYDFDIFIYSNDVLHEKNIRESWESVARKIVVELPRDFEADIEESSIELDNFSPLEEFRTLQNTLAFLNSRAQSIDMMQKYANKHGETYDWIVTCRFDLGQIDRYNGARPQKVSEINFNPELDSSYIYSAMWNQSNAGLADQWFYGNQENISKLSLMPDRCLQYFKNESNYLKMIVSGIPYSNQQNAFSNECLLDAKIQSKNLVSIEEKSAINNHLIHKYFFLEQNIFESHRMVGNISNVARVLYSHTDYSDCWPIYFGQIEKYMNCFRNNYIIVNKRDPRIPAFFQQVVYDDALPYVDRLIFGLSQIQEEIIFFEHEDMIVNEMPCTSLIENYSKLIKTKPIHILFPWKLDVIRLIQGGKFLSIPFPGKKFNKLNRISRLSPWIFSLQPSLWSRSGMIKVLRKHRGQTIWEFERKVQWTFRKSFLAAGTIKENLAKIGLSHWQSEIYPYIATAIFKGKWNFSEYGAELEELLEEYRIDPNIRGKI